jgi:hypothetical protein
MSTVPLSVLDPTALTGNPKTIIGIFPAVVKFAA